MFGLFSHLSLAAAIWINLVLMLALLVLGVMHWRGSVAHDQIRRRLAFARSAPITSVAPRKRFSPADLASGIGHLAFRIGLISATSRAALERSLNAAGLGKGRGLVIFVGAKIALCFGIPALALVIGRIAGASERSMTLCALIGFVTGLLLPDMVVRHIQGNVIAAVRGGLPDALDLLLICTQSGLGLEAAIERVGIEMIKVHPRVAQEFLQTHGELRLTGDRKRALLAMGERTGLPQLRALGVTLIQTIQFGTPISQALRVLAQEMRQDALIGFEERAARLPVLLTLPMILFVLPCVFIVVGGPAVVRISHLF